MEDPPYFDIEISTKNQEDLRCGASQVVLKIREEWKERELKFKFFNDGITNTLLGIYENNDKSNMVLIR